MRRAAAHLWPHVNSVVHPERLIAVHAVGIAIDEIAADRGPWTLMRADEHFGRSRLHFTMFFHETNDRCTGRANTFGTRDREQTVRRLSR